MIPPTWVKTYDNDTKGEPWSNLLLSRTKIARFGTIYRHYKVQGSNENWLVFRPPVNLV